MFDTPGLHWSKLMSQTRPTEVKF